MRVLALGGRVCDEIQLVKESEVDEIDPPVYPPSFHPSPADRLTLPGQRSYTLDHPKCGLFCCRAMCVQTLPLLGPQMKTDRGRVALL